MANMTQTKTEITAAAMKRKLTFAVTVNGNLVAAFTHPSDATDYIKVKQPRRPDIKYQIEAQ